MCLRGSGETPLLPPLLILFLQPLQVMSELGTLDEHTRCVSPEDRIAKLLLAVSGSPAGFGSQGVTPAAGGSGDPAALMTQMYLNHTLSVGSKGKVELTEGNRQQLAAQHTAIETLLLEGRREEAVAKALECDNWALAIVVASVCSRETYQGVIKAFADANFPKASGLNLLTLVYSSQADSAVKHGGRALTSTPAADHVALSPEFVWRRNLAAVLTNKVGDWSSLVRHIGDRILQETGVRRPPL